MLHELRIENLLLIERAELSFGSGLNAITGETGAGKTMLTHALDLLMGGRARPQLVRPGAEEAYVEGVFAVPPGLFEDPELSEMAERLDPSAEEIVLARRVTPSRSSALIGGRAASAPELQLLGRRLVAFFGQHEHRRLVLGSAQMQILDRSGGPELVDLRDAHRVVHAELVDIERRLEEIQDREGARERELDLLRFELDEIEALAPDPAEVESLRTERESLRHADRLRGAASTAADALSGGESDGGSAHGLAEAAGALREVTGVDPGLDATAERVEALMIELDDVAAEFRSRLGAYEGDPNRLELVEARLDSLDRVARKHGGSIEAVLAHAETCRSRIAELAGAEELSAELVKKADACRSERIAAGKRLTAARRKAATALESAVAAELSHLAMEGATLEVRLEPHPGGVGPNGAEQVELLISPNPGLAPSALKDSASGGELSRVMLALTGVSGGADTPTVVFDEIDAGIGGHTARAVGERLRTLGDRRQVLCVTHLPQVASLAERHFRVEKTARAGATSATVERIAGDELVEELCRMLGAEGDDPAAARHARELLAA